MTDFAVVENVWADRLGTLRNVVRQHLIGEQLKAYTSGAGTVLDVGCGQGTQALALASRGYSVTGVDPSTDLLDRLGVAAQAAGLSVEALRGTIEDLDHLIGDQTFDVVCAHGLLMYLADARAAVVSLAQRVAPGGLLSFTFRNGDALAFRPGIRGQWAEALGAFESTNYINELGAPATAQALDEVLAWCSEVGLTVEAWFGVRVLTDAADPTDLADPSSIDAVLAAELIAGQRDPYRHLGSQVHIIARRR